MTQTSTCGSPPTKSFRSSSSAIVTSDVSIDSAMLFDGNYKQSETEKVICIGSLMIALRGHCFYVSMKFRQTDCSNAVNFHSQTS